MNSNVTQMPINGYFKKIQKGDMKNSNVTRKPGDGFVKKIQKGDM